ncbi:MAG: hypothetical protein GX827_01435 [Clostridiales bacterium]|nr:hypothetical protein [Clostridiales bacterium]
MTGKQLLSFILAAILLISAMTACGGEGDGVPAHAADTQETTTAEETTQSELEQHRAISDNLPETDFGGAEYRILCRTDRAYEIDAEEQTGAVENDSVYERNRKIEERFNVVIKSITCDAPHSKIISPTLAGEYAYELTAHNAYNANEPISKGVYTNFLDIPHIDLEMPWYNRLSNDSATINGRLFAATGDLALTSMMFTYGIFFNKRICESYGYPDTDLYAMVNDNKWTIDNFIGIVSAIYEDINGNGETDDSDLYGFGEFPCDPADVWLTSFGQTLTGRDNEGKIIVTIMTEKTQSALEKIVTMLYSTPGVRAYTEQWLERQQFSAGLMAFAPLAFENCFNTCRAMSDSYGILPNPKWDEQQEKYLTQAFDEYSVFGVPISVPQDKLDLVGVIFEALSAESYKTVYPAYYDVALKGKYSEDADTAKMVDLIMDGRIFDFSYQFGIAHFKRLPYWFRDLVVARSTDFASYYEKNISSVETGLEKLYKIYE